VLYRITGSTCERGLSTSLLAEWAPKPMLCVMQWADGMFERSGQLEVFGVIFSADKQMVSILATVTTYRKRAYGSRGSS